MPARERPDVADPGLAEQVCLALVAEGVGHGYAVAALLSPDGELGRIWTLSRPLTYRSIDLLHDRGLITRTGTSPGRGRDRRTIAVTARGRRASRTWLDRPVVHVREIRTELLLKLELRRRAGLELGPFLEAQRAELAPVLSTLTRVDEPDLVELWRRESARAVRRFLDAAVVAVTDVASEPRADPAVRDDLLLSARNQLDATVVGLVIGDQVCTVTAELADAQIETATITRGAVDELDLTVGDRVVVITKATDTLVARRISADG